MTDKTCDQKSLQNMVGLELISVGETFNISSENEKQIGNSVNFN